MSSDTNFNIDVNQLISSMFGSNKDRNDLVVGIRNDTNSSIKVNYYIDHGSLRDVSSGNEIRPGELWEAGVHAKGAGSNITMSIEITENKSGWAIMCATPVNKENYFKVQSQPTPYGSPKDAYKAADKTKKHYSDDGVYDEQHNGYIAVISMTGESPAACTIVIKESHH